MNTEIAFTVRANLSVRPSLLDEEDVEVAGDHIVRVPQAWASLPEDELAAAILDQFHECVAVNMPEYFEFIVIAPDGRELSEH